MKLARSDARASVVPKFCDIGIWLKSAAARLTRHILFAGGGATALATLCGVQNMAARRISGGLPYRIAAAPGSSLTDWIVDPL